MKRWTAARGATISAFGLCCWFGGCNDDLLNGDGIGGTNAGGPDVPAHGGAGSDDLARVALRVEARADVVTRGSDVIRVAVPLTGPIDAASDSTRWSIVKGGAALTGGQLFVFPAVGDSTQAGAAVWLFPQAGNAGDEITVRFDDAVVFAGPLGAPAALGTVNVAPIIVRTPDADGPSASNEELASQMRVFAALLAEGCNITLEVEAAREVTLAGFGKLEETDFVSVDDSEILAALQEATGEPVGVLLSQRMQPLYEAVAVIAPTSSRSVRALVFAQHQSSEQANAIVPAFFHSDDVAALYGIDPYYGGAGLPSYWFDPDKSLEEQTLVRLSDTERERTYAIYFGEDHLQAFAHELGHLLGLPHPSGSSVIDAEDGDGKTNLMNSADECLPQCAPRISPQQCEIMLLGMTGFVGP